MPAGSTVVDPRHWVLRLPHGGELVLGGRPLVMGVLNITPDSFSDGGLWHDRDRALAHALDMAAAGADVLDLGAESTRPGGGVYGEGAETVGPAREIDRLLPVLEALRPLTQLPISADTRKGAVARAALDGGADLVNDISGCSDPELGAAVAEAGAPLVLMHSRGRLREMQRGIAYRDVLGEVAAELAEAVGRAEAAGVARDQLILDPGIGFGKTVRHNVELIAGLEQLAELGRPLMLGASRKSFIADLTGAGVDRRLPGSLAAVGWAMVARAAIVRVHDVAETVQFMKVFGAFEQARRSAE